MRNLERKILIPWLGIGLLVSIVLTSLAGIALIASESFNITVVAAFFLLFASLISFYTVLRYQNWSFEMREDYLYLEHGVIKKVKTKVPYVRVQHVDTQRGIVDRVFGLSQMVVYTAGSRGADVGIPGLLPRDADEIQEELRKVAVKSEEEFGDGV